ncbi:MAG: hypothetical protein R2939_21505 [Kofleriaceae bacterium]
MISAHEAAATPDGCYIAGVRLAVSLSVPIARLHHRRAAQVGVAILRLALGFAFVPAGLKKVLGQPFTDPGNHGPFHDFLHAFHATGGFYRAVGALQLAVAVLLLTQRRAGLGAVLAVPVLTAIVGLCWSTAVYPTAIVATAMWLGALALVAWELPRHVAPTALPATPPIDATPWAWCGAGILVAYGALCLWLGEVYRPRRVDAGDPAFYVMPMIALSPLGALAAERVRRRRRQ